MIGSGLQMMMGGVAGEQFCLCLEILLVANEQGPADLDTLIGSAVRQ